MSTIALPAVTRRPKLRSAGNLGARRRAPVPPPARTPPPVVSAPTSRARILFSVAFESAMSDADVALLSGPLELMTHLHPKLWHSPAAPAVVRIDFFSGVFLERGSADGRWALEGRTWGDPPAWFVHGWHRRAASAARRLDPRVQLPEYRDALERPAASYPAGHAANRRLRARWQA